MLDLVSVILKVVGILQNMQKKQTVQEKVAEIRLILAEADRVYLVLRTAKQTHDQFDTFRTTYLKGFLEDYSRTTSIPKITNLLDRLIAGERNIIGEDGTNVQLELKTQTGNKIDAHELWTGKIDDCPVEVINHTQNIHRKYPDYLDGLASHRSNMEQLGALAAVENCGVALKGCVKSTIDQVDRVTNAADKLILDTCPLLDFIHSELKQALGTIQ